MGKMTPRKNVLEPMILAYMGDRELTARDVSKKFNMYTRGAGKLLSKMARQGVLIKKCYPTESRDKDYYYQVVKPWE